MGFRYACLSTVPAFSWPSKKKKLSCGLPFADATYAVEKKGIGDVAYDSLLQHIHPEHVHLSRLSQFHWVPCGARPNRQR
jgi:hypothetical protein